MRLDRWRQTRRNYTRKRCLIRRILWAHLSAFFKYDCAGKWTDLNTMPHLCISLPRLSDSNWLGVSSSTPATWPPLLAGEWVEPEGPPLLRLPLLQVENVQQLLRRHALLQSAGLYVRTARGAVLRQSAKAFGQDTVTIISQVIGFYKYLYVSTIIKIQPTALKITMYVFLADKDPAVFLKKVTLWRVCCCWKKQRLLKS